MLERPTCSELVEGSLSTFDEASWPGTAKGAERDSWLTSESSQFDKEAAEPHCSKSLLSNMLSKISDKSTQNDLNLNESDL